MKMFNLEYFDGIREYGLAKEGKDFDDCVHQKGIFECDTAVSYKTLSQPSECKVSHGEWFYGYENLYVPDIAAEH